MKRKLEWNRYATIESAMKDIHCVEEYGNYVILPIAVVHEKAMA